MRSVDEVQAAIDSTVADLRHLDELRAMQNLNQGFSDIRNRALGEVERLMNEKKDALEWVLGLK